MSDIISELKNAIPSNLLPGIAQSIGESESAVTKTLGGIFPVLLGSIMKTAGSPGGANIMGEMMGLLKKAPSLDSLTKDPTSLLNSLTGQGDGIASKFLSLIMGNKGSDITSFLTNFAGIKGSSVTSLLGLAGPVLAGFLGKKVTGGGLSLGGLMSYLTSQKQSIINAAPDCMNSLLGMDNLNGLGDNLSNLVGGGADEVKAAIRKKSGLLIPALIAAALAIGGYALFKSFASKNYIDQEAISVVENVHRNTQAAATNIASEVESTAKDLWAHLGDFSNAILPSGVELHIPEFGIENKLLGFIGDPSQLIDTNTWFSFDRLLFETGSATLKANSHEQLNNVAEIMKAYPNVDIKIGGYTDNTGDVAANLTLSQHRADSVKQQLVKLGVAENRIDAVGFGEEHPVASNDTDEGRAKNRRIDILVTNK